MAIWIAAAVGIASRAPITRGSVPPKIAATTTKNGSSDTAPLWIRGWMT
jgi:hypothetical protein